jgi:hypothetical protein
LDTGHAQHIYKEGIRWQSKIKVVAVVNKPAVRRVARAVAAVSKVAAAAARRAARAAAAVSKVAAAVAVTDNHN